MWPQVRTAWLLSAEFWWIKPLPGHDEKMWTVQQTYTVITCPAPGKRLCPSSPIEGHKAKAELIVVPHLTWLQGLAQEVGTWLYPPRTFQTGGVGEGRVGEGGGNGEASLLWSGSWTGKSPKPRHCIFCLMEREVWDREVHSQDEREAALERGGLSSGSWLHLPPKRVPTYPPHGGCWRQYISLI